MPARSRGDPTLRQRTGAAGRVARGRKRRLHGALASVQLRRGAARMATLQERHLAILMERIRQDRYPSHQLMDRVEAAFWNGEQVAEYVDLLIEKADESWYPSLQMLDRIHRVLAMVAPVAR